jgi:hypothetical protein
LLQPSRHGQLRTWCRPRNRNLFFCHVGRNIGKERRAEGALGGTDHSETDTGIAARRLDDAECEPILDRSKRIEGLDLDEEIDARRAETIDPDDRRVADGFQDVVEPASYSSLLRLITRLLPPIPHSLRHRA